VLTDSRHEPCVRNEGLKWDKSNPTGRDIPFLIRGSYVYCYVQRGRSKAF